MGSMVRAALGLSFLVATASGAYAAKCGANAGDEAAVVAARADVAAMCDCAGSTNHGTFVKCAAGRANALSSGNSPTLPKSCKGVVKKCAAKSTCGKGPDFVTCCITTGSGTKCKVTKSDTCTKKNGTPTLSSDHTSCCSTNQPVTAKDACAASPSGAFLE